MNSSRLFDLAAGMIILAVTTTSGAATQVTINLQGRVPTSIPTGFLETNYTRITNSIAPGKPLDSTPITIIYYGKGDARKLGVRLPEWGGGGAIGRDTVIVPIDKAPLADMEIDRTTLHELVHIALERSFGRLRVPRWFHEGLAMTLSGEISFEEQVALSRAIVTNRLLRLDSIESVNRFDAYGAALAYSQSHLTVLFIINSWGMDAIPDLLAAVRATGTFDAALFSVFGLTKEEFERLAQSSIIQRYRYLFLISDTWLYWLPGALLVIVGFIMIRFRNKKRLAQMELEEKRSRSHPFRSVSPSTAEEPDEDDEELNEDGTEPDDEEEFDETEEPEKPGR
jgi:hypothetical protein